MTTATSMLSEPTYVLHFKDPEVIDVCRLGYTGLFLVTIARYGNGPRIGRFTCSKDIAAIYYRKYMEQEEARKREQIERSGVIYPQRKRFSKYKVMCILRTIALVGALIFGMVVFMLCIV